MLVSGLKNTLLSQISSGKSVNYPELYETLCQCASDMLAKYKKKQESDTKLAVKIRATEILLCALYKIPEDQRVSQKAISSALKLHTLALLGYEHLLSTRGNTFALIYQTQDLMEDYAPAHLLRYHRLKNKLLGSDARLSPEQKEIIYELAESRDLTLEVLEILEILNEAGLLRPDLCGGVFRHRFPCMAARALVDLNEADLLEPVFCIAVLRHKYPMKAVIALVTLNKAGLLNLDLCDKILKHEKPVSVAQAVVELKQQKLDTPANRSAVVNHNNSFDAFLAIFRLHTYRLLTDINRDQVLSKNDPVMAATDLVNKIYPSAI